MQKIQENSNFAGVSPLSILRPVDVCKTLNISKTTFYRLVKNGKLKLFKISERASGIKAADLDAFVNGGL